LSRLAGGKVNGRLRPPRPDEEFPQETALLSALPVGDRPSRASARAHFDTIYSWANRYYDRLNSAFPGTGWRWDVTISTA
jgi:hypothetical protein